MNTPAERQRPQIPGGWRGAGQHPVKIQGVPVKSELVLPEPVLFTDVYSVKHAGSIAYIGDTVFDSRRSINITAGIEFQHRTAVPGDVGVTKSLGGTDDNNTAGNRRGGGHVPAGIAAPQTFPGSGVDGVQEAVVIADINDTVGDGRGRAGGIFHRESPDFFAGFGVNGIQVAVVAADV